MGLDPSEAEDHVCPEGAPAWLATMGDLMSNLLVFFVLMLSFANTDRRIFQQTMESIQTALGIVDGEAARFDPNTPIDWPQQAASACESPRPDRASKTPSIDQKIMQQIQQAIARNALSRVVEAEAAERGVVLRVRGKALFKSDSDQLLPVAFVFLDEIVRIAEQFPYELSIEGHTDDGAVDLQRYPTSWHLSTARSIAVLQYMMERGRLDPSRIAVSGFGSTRPLVPNDSAENRAINRRVEFVFKRDPMDDRTARARRRAADAARAATNG